MILLETYNLTKRFRGLTAVDNVNLSVNTGDFITIVGPNGAGKTTLINLISGHILPTDGEIYFKGIDIKRKPVHERVRLGISRTFQLTYVFPSLTVFENVVVAVQRRYINGLSYVFPFGKEYNMVKQQVGKMLREFNLYDLRDVKLGNTSYGIRKYVEIMIALACEPELLLLDEPLSGLPTDEALNLLSFIKDTLRKKYTIVMVEHKLNFIKDFVEKMIVMHLGKIIAKGTYNEIINNTMVREVYIGKRARMTYELT
jgi:ABC-type branched-subunit amino acid transport system ATPase component